MGAFLLFLKEYERRVNTGRAINCSSLLGNGNPYNGGHVPDIAAVGLSYMALVR